MTALPALLILCASALAGGIPAVGPDYHGPPQVETPAAYKNTVPPAWKKAQPSDSQARGDWWAVFHDPVLNRIETHAVTANQDIALAVDRISEVRADVGVAAADFLPNIDTASPIRRRSSAANYWATTPSPVRAQAPRRPSLPRATNRSSSTRSLSPALTTSSIFPST
jgi:outer membrane protein, multidrug efflux system